MTLAVSKRTRIRRLEEGRSRAVTLPLAERLRLARLRVEKHGTRTPREYLAHMERVNAANPTPLNARLLRAAQRVAGLQDTPKEI